METARRTLSSPHLPQYQLTQSHSSPHLFQQYGHVASPQAHAAAVPSYCSPQIPMKAAAPPMIDFFASPPLSPAPVLQQQQQQQQLYFSSQHSPVLQPQRQYAGTPGPMRRDVVDRSAVVYHTPQVTRLRQPEAQVVPRQQQLDTMRSDRPVYYDTTQDRREEQGAADLETSLAQSGEEPVPRGTPRTTKRAKRCVTRGLKSAFNFLAQMDEVDNAETRQIDSEFIDDEKEKRRAEELQAEREYQEKKLQRKLRRNESAKKWALGKDGQQDGWTFQYLNESDDDLCLGGQSDGEPFLSRKASNF